MNDNTLQNNQSTRAPAVVVGVDGSPGARAALRWALREARLRNSPVRAVHAWMFGYIGGSVEGYPYWGGSIGSYTSLGVDLNDLHRAAEDLLDRALADVEDEAEGIEIERQIIQGPAADVLVRAASPYDLLVVGSRGHGGFTGLMLGSVSQQCVHHAHCPVVVVHSLSTAADREPAAVAQTESPAAA
jgi:nucleotide-binding universal stress UspA family protein